MDLRKIKTLIQLLQESELAEIEVTDGEQSVRISRASKVAAAPAMQAVTVAAAPGEDAEKAAAPEVEEAAPEGEQVTSPMVGTFYAAPSPTSPPFVRVGDRVQAGDVLCVIEAMKTMNHIESEYSGEVAAILVENAEPVEYGQPLFVIRT